MSHLISPRSADILLLAWVQHSGADDVAPGMFSYASYQARWEALCDKWGGKQVISKMYDLAAKGYLDYGVSVRTAWLTEKGRLKLAEYLQALDHRIQPPWASGSPA